MYLVKFGRHGLGWKVHILEKKWSESMSSYEINEICSKKFLFHRSGYKWINKQICKSLFERHEMEIVNG